MTTTYSTAQSPREELENFLIMQQLALDHKDCVMTKEERIGAVAMLAHLHLFLESPKSPVWDIQGSYILGDLG